MVNNIYVQTLLLNIQLTFSWDETGNVHRSKAKVLLTRPIIFRSINFYGNYRIFRTSKVSENGH